MKTLSLQKLNFCPYEIAFELGTTPENVIKTAIELKKIPKELGELELQKIKNAKGGEKEK